MVTSEKMGFEKEKLERRLQIYQGLVEVSTLINSILNYQDLLKAVLEVARRVIKAEAASLFLVDKNKSELELVLASYGSAPFSQPNIRIPKGKGIAGWVFEHQEPLLIADAYEDPRFYAEADRSTGFTTRSILCAPIMRDQSIDGVLQVLNPENRQAFDEVDLEGFIAYANLIATALEKARALDQIKAQERMMREVSIASEIQDELLSRALPPELHQTEFAAYNRAAQNVGGDFYLVIEKNPYETYFAIGDVSGKGIPAALMMAQTMSALQFVIAGTTSPANALSKLNHTLVAGAVRGMFVTVLIGRITSGSNRVELASAGHCQPYLVQQDGTAKEISITGGMPIGIKAGVHYHQTKVAINPGEWIVSFTDGLSESKHYETGDFFEARMSDLLQGRFVTPEQVVQCLIQAEQSHRNGGVQRDDLTILVGGPK